MGATALSTLVMSLALALGCFLTPAVVGQHRYTNIPLSALSKAMLGIDPMKSNPLGKKDPGLMDQIFVLTSFIRDCNTIALNDFIGKAVKDVRCDRLADLSMRTASNMNSYLEMKKLSFSFKTRSSVSASIESIGGSVSASLGFNFDNEDKKYFDFFLNTGGEIVQGVVQCQTHVVSINLDAKPVFTENFLSGLRKLNLASQDPGSHSSRSAFSDFVRNYGTHYQDLTYLGSKLVVEKLFVHKAANMTENTHRHRCISSAFNTNLRANFLIVQAERDLSLDSAKCSDSAQAKAVFDSLGVSSERIITVGTPPYSDPDEWARHATLSPVPIHYTLEKISRLFLQDWFSSLSDDLNGTAMHEFFENMSSQYCETMLGAPCTAGRTGCGFNSNCKLGEKCVSDDSTEGFSCVKGCGFTSDCSARTICVNDDTLIGFACKDPLTLPNVCASDKAIYSEPHSAKGYICVSSKPGQAVIAGGNNGDEAPLYKEVEHVNYRSFPELPRGVEKSAMAQLNEHTYMCGGMYKDFDGSEHPTNECYRIHATRPEERWHRIKSAPIYMGSTHAVSIGNSSIWFISYSKLVKYDSNTNSFSITTLPFHVQSYPCLVGIGTHAYIIGVGASVNEIWRNEKEMDETRWLKVGQLTLEKQGRGCLLYDSNIVITGGVLLSKSVEMFNIETNEVWEGKDLLDGRHHHRMMLYNGMPTVLGGYCKHAFSKSFESFSLRENRWIRQHRIFSNLKDRFAILEIGE